MLAELQQVHSWVNQSRVAQWKRAGTPPPLPTVKRRMFSQFSAGYFYFVLNCSFFCMQSLMDFHQVSASEEEGCHPPTRRQFTQLYYYFCLLIVIIISQVVGIYLWYAIFPPKILDVFLHLLCLLLFYQYKKIVIFLYR